MMYYLNKIVGFIVSPIGGAIIGAVCVLVLSWLGRKRVARWICGLTVAWLWLWMTPIMTRVVGEPLEREFLVGGRVPTVECFPKADVIVLLGGSMGVDTNLSAYAEMWSGADRVWQAARLWKAGKSPKVIATGNDAVNTTLPLLKDFGLSSEVVSFHNARNTEEEAKRIAKMGYKKILLVTSAWHMKRAQMMFEKYAPKIEVLCAPADFENCAAVAKPFSVTDFLPDPGAFIGNSAALHEWVGIVGYQLFR